MIQKLGLYNYRLLLSSFRLVSFDYFEYIVFIYVTVCRLHTSFLYLLNTIVSFSLIILNILFCFCWCDRLSFTYLILLFIKHDSMESGRIFLY